MTSHAIVVNEQIRHLSTSLAPTEQGSPLAGRPLVSLTFAINYALGGLNVRGYRLVNIAIHVLNALLLFAIAARTPSGPRCRACRERRIRGRADLDGPSARHRAGRLRLAADRVDDGDVLPGHAVLRSACPRRVRRIRPPLPKDSSAWLGSSVACCALGMACKETMVVAPVVVLLYDRTFTFGSFREALRRRGRYYAALCATWLVLVALLWSSPRGDSAGFAGASVSPWTYLLNQSVMIVRYLRLAFWPRGLVLDYGEPLHVTFADVAPYAIAVATLLAATIIALVRNPSLGFLGAWFFLTLAPTSSILPISTEVGAERRMYLPLMAIVTAVVVVVRRFVGARVRGSRPAHPRTGAPANLAFAVLAVLLSLGTVQRNREYLSGLTLWQSVLDRWPPHARAHRNLAAELKLANRPDEEIVHLRAAVKDLPGIRNVLGLELLALGRNAEAADELRTYVRDYPRDADAWANLGNAFSALGRNDEALQAFQRAIAIDPNNGLSQRNLALQFLQQNDFDNAVSHAREAARLTPNDPAAHNLLGLALIGQQKIDEAIAEFRASLALQPGNNDAAGYLERTLKATARSPRAESRGLP